MARDPSFTILYGDLKSGKTTAALAAFPNAVFVAAPGALSPAEYVWGFPQPTAYDLATFRDLHAFATTLTPAHGALVIDDATLLADRTVNVYKSKGLGGYDLWGAVLTSAERLGDECRRKGIHVVMTCHPIVAEIKNGVRLLGGPNFPGQTRGKLPALADLLLRVEPAPEDAIGWPMVIRSALHPDWLQGSRYNTPDPAPMNLREILNHAGFKLPRIRGLEWQDKVADQVAQKVLEIGFGEGTTDKIRAALAKARDTVLAKITKDPRHAMWAIKDGYDRAVLTLAAGANSARIWGF